MMKSEKNYSKKNYNVNNFTKKKTKKKESRVAKVARQYVAPKEIRAGMQFEYKMPIPMYEDILKECKKDGGEAQVYLCNWVNEQFGLLGTCVRVIPG